MENYHKYQIAQKLRAIFMLVLVGALFQSCEDGGDPVTYSYDPNTIGMMMDDNFNLSVACIAISRAELDVALKEDGAYTFLAPSDNAFAEAGYNDESIYAWGKSELTQTINYHLINGEYDLEKLPFLFNQKLETEDGGRLFVTHWIKDSDTLLTVNGSVVQTEKVTGSNGYLYVIDKVLKPYEHSLISEAIGDVEELTLFNYALELSGYKEILNGEGPFTVFAPDNGAMRAAGYTSLQVIQNTGTEVLREMVSYHIMADFRFVYDYVLTTGDRGEAQQNMLNGYPVTVILTGNGSTGVSNGIRLQGVGNGTYVDLTRQNIYAGNGILHVINGVLQVNQ